MTVLDKFRLDDKVVVVTGASSGLGVSFAKACAEAGADVAIAARRIEKLVETEKLVTAAGRRAFSVQTDITDPRRCEAMVGTSRNNGGRERVLASTR